MMSHVTIVELDAADIDLTALSVSQLTRLHTALVDEIQHRGTRWQKTAVSPETAEKGPRPSNKRADLMRGP